MARLGLHMIVKDEAAIIERCLRSVLPVIDWWVVCDTGSTDGTQDVVRRVLAEVPGELIERAWVSFGHNRQEALEAARASPHAGPGDYSLWLDADDQLTDPPADPAAAWADLAADGYFLEVDFGGTRFQRLGVLRLDRPWTWRGAVHEYLDLPGGSFGELHEPRLRVAREGARSRDPDVFRKDAALLERELERVPEDPRSQYYLAQSYRDAGEWALALAAFEVRAANPAGWDQERWYAAFQVARCRERLEHPSAEVAAAYLDAYAARPDRAEPLVELARLERHNGRFEVGALYARAALRIPEPARGALFVDTAAYGWRAYDELAVSCYWAGRHDEGRRAAEQAIEANPEDPRLRENLEWFDRAARSRDATS